MLVTIAVQAIEVELAILHLYNLINKRLPGWQDAPSRDEIKVWPNMAASQIASRGRACLSAGSFAW